MEVRKFFRLWQKEYIRILGYLLVLLYWGLQFSKTFPENPRGNVVTSTVDSTTSGAVVEVLSHHKIY